MFERTPATSKTILCTVAAVAGFAVVIAVFNPGYMSNDSLDQLAQARTGMFDARHPPIMAYVWSVLDRIVPGPLGMLMLQNAIFWSGLSIVVALSTKTPASALLVLAVGLWPAVLGELGTIWKDVHMTASLVLAFGLLLLGRRSRRPGFVASAVVALLYAGALRLNAAPAVLPLAVFAGVVLARLAWPDRPWRSVVAGAAVVALVVGGGKLVNRSLVHGREAAPFQSPLVHDLVAISLATGTDLLPAYLHHGPRPLVLRNLQELFHTESLDALFFTPATPIWVTSDPDQMRSLYSAWWTAVRAHPRQYLEHRLALFAIMLGAHRGPVWYPYHEQIDPNSLGVELHRTALNRTVMSFLSLVRNSILFRGWSYLLVMVAVLGACAARPSRWPATLALGTSGILYVVPYFFVTPAADFRYVWWPVVGTLLLPFALAADRLEQSATIAPSTQASRACADSGLQMRQPG